LAARSIDAERVPGVKHCAQPPDTLARHVDVDIHPEAGNALAHTFALQANFLSIDAKARGGYCFAQFVTRNDGVGAISDLFAQSKACRELNIVRGKSDVIGVARIRHMVGTREAKQRTIKRYGDEVRERRRCWRALCHP